MTMTTRCKRFLLPTFLLALTAALALPAHADTLIYSTGFEGPTFATGDIAGQDGWSKFGSGIATVESSFAKTGTQAVFMDGGTASQSGPYRSDSAAGALFVELSADIAIFTSSTQTEWQFAGLGPGLVPFLGGINVLPNGSIQAITAGFPIIGSFSRATAFDATAWHRIALLFDMAAQKYDVSLDGTTIGSGLAFCGSNAGCTGANVAAYGSAVLDSFGTGNDSAYMDNFRLAAVPEPSSTLLLLTGLGGVAAVLRRRLSA